VLKESARRCACASSETLHWRSEVFSCASALVMVVRRMQVVCLVQGLFACLIRDRWFSSSSCAPSDESSIFHLFSTTTLWGVDLHSCYSYARRVDLNQLISNYLLLDWTNLGG
jgi:hypothetical protein